MFKMISPRLWSCIGIALMACACSGGDDDGKSKNMAGSGAGSAGSSGAAAGGAGGAGTTAGMGVAGMDMFIDGPAITSAPDAWVRPADCHGVGEMCDFLSCPGGAICQSIGDVCVPELIDNQFPPKSAEHPYCAAFTCLSFDEASCLCTGPLASMQAGCGSPAELAGLCVGQGASCEESACCGGLTCFDDFTYGKLCVQPCKKNEDCDTDCCTDPFDTGNTICAIKSACDNPCKKRGDTTCDPGSATTPTDCCTGTCSKSENPDIAGCRPYCMTNDDCDTGCCLPFSNSDRGECVIDKYCKCLEPGTTCGADTSACCEGSMCIGDETGSMCAKTCKEASDCSTNCCVQITGADYKACLDPKYCP